MEPVRFWKTSQFAALLAAMLAVALVLVALFRVEWLSPILGNAFGLINLLALAAGVTYVLVHRWLNRRNR